MEAKHLNDPFDQFKAMSLGTLHRAGVFKNLIVDPMTTELTRWSEADWAAYAHTLGVDRQAVRSTHYYCGAPPKKHISRKHREEQKYYWSRVVQETESDLFLDPNTGIGDAGAANYLSSKDLFGIAKQHPQRIVAIYQHGPRMNNYSMASRINGLMRDIRRRDEEAECFCCSCEAERGYVVSGVRGLIHGVAILFLSCDENRMRAVYDCLIASLPRDELLTTKMHSCV